MKNKKQNTDHLYRKILHKAEANPPANAWDKLEKDLNFAVKTRKIIYYRRFAAIAAVVLIFMTAGIIYLISENKTYKNEIAEQNIIEKPVLKKESQNNFTELKNEISEKEENLNVIAEDKQNSFEKESELFEETIKIIDAPKILAVIIDKKEEIQKPELQKILPLYVTELKIKLEFDLALMQKETKELKIDIIKPNDFNFSEELYADNFVPDKKSGKSKWTLGGDFSPSYISLSQNIRKDFTASNVAFLNSDLDTETPLIAYTGGLNVDYQISDKWSFQSGMYYLKQGQEIQDFVVLKNNYEGANNSSSNTSIGNITFQDQNQAFENETVINETDFGFDVVATQFDSYLIQNFEFLEIPFIIKYKLLDKKFGICVLGGFNTSFLIGNNVYLEGNNSPIGKTEDINTLIYKSIIGFVFEYPVSDKISINITPSYKYQLNSINKISFSNVRMQYFDFKTGISYRL